MSSSGLEEVLRKARNNFDSSEPMIEAEVQTSVVRPVLRALGWDDADRRQYRVEYPVDGGRVDEALIRPHGKPLVFVEVKRPGELNPKAEDQLFRYANNEGVPLLVLTDGDTWDLYLSMAEGKPTERRFARCKLTESSDLSGIAQDFRTFLKQSDVLSGAARKAAELRLDQVKRHKIGRGGLESAWMELLGEPDDMLRDLLIERVEQEVGARPTTDDAERFLRQEAAARPASPPPGRPDHGEEAPPPPAKPRRQGRLRGFNFHGAQFTAPNAAAVVALLADTLAAVDPAFLQHWAGSGRGGNLPRAIRTGDALLADPKRRNWYTRLPEHTDWYVFTSVNQRVKLRIMQDMAEVAGLMRDRDIYPALD